MPVSAARPCPGLRLIDPKRWRDRRWRTVGSILGAIALALASARPAFTEQDGANLRNIKAQDFLNTFGVNVHFHENGYKNIQALAEALHTIGLSRVRGTCESEADVSAWKALAGRTAAFFPVRAESRRPYHRLSERA